MKRVILIIALLFIVIPRFSQAQFWKRSVNKIDENNKKTGLWINYWDDEKEHIMIKYHFRDGKETKVCKNFHLNGKVSIKFKYIGDRIRVKYFGENGKLTHKGWAKIEYGKDIHYYWHGEWKFYNANRKLLHTSTFKNGERIELIEEQAKL